MREDFSVQGFYSEFEKAVQYVEKGNKKDIPQLIRRRFMQARMNHSAVAWRLIV